MLQERINFKTYRKGSWQLIPSFAGIALLLLLFLALVPLPTTSAHAEGDNGATTFSAWLSPSVTLTMADSVSEDIEPTVSGTFKNLATVAHVEVNNSDYYEVSLHASSKDMVSSSTTNDPQAKISSITAAQNQASFTPNQWGYNLTKNPTGVTTATPTTTETEYQPITTTATAMPGIGKQATTNNAASDYYTLNFGAKVDTSLPADTYTSEVVLSVVASPKQVYGFDRTDTMQGMTADICKEIGSDTDLANGGATKYAATDSLGNTYYTKRLKDLRDGKLYWVAKLKDGNCWMTQNLALDIPASGLTSELTALAPGKTSWRPQEATRTTTTPNRFTLPCTGASTTKPVTISGKTYTDETACLNADADHSWNEGKYVMIYPGAGNAGLWIGMKAKEAGVDQDKNGTVQDGLSSFGDKAEVISQSTAERKNPTELTSLQGSKVLTDHGVVIDVSDGWTASTDPDFTEGSAYIANDGKTVVTKTPINTGAREITDGLAIDYGRKVYDSHYLIGNYYQWLAATAQTVAEGQTVTAAGAKVEGSVCAKGWELPTSGSYGGGAGTLNNPTYNSASGSFFNLVKTYAGDALDAKAQDNGVNGVTGYSSLTNNIKQVAGTNVKVSDVLVGSPIHFVRAGAAYAFSEYLQIRDVGADVDLWSSVVISSDMIRSIVINAWDVVPSHFANRTNAYPVRCLVNAAS